MRERGVHIKAILAGKLSELTADSEIDRAFDLFPIWRSEIELPV